MGGKWLWRTVEPWGRQVPTREGTQVVSFDPTHRRFCFVYSTGASLYGSVYSSIIDTANERDNAGLSSGHLRGFN